MPAAQLLSVGGSAEQDGLERGLLRPGPGANRKPSKVQPEVIKELSVENTGDDGGQHWVRNYIVEAHTLT